MRRCARGSGEPENVHQLRVATRRIDAVLRLFAALYPPRRLKKARKQVRRLRQAARQVRDLDVLLDRLQPSDDPDADLSALGAELRLRRDDAMHTLRRALRKGRRRRLRSRFRRLLSEVDSHGPLAGKAPGELAGVLLRPHRDAFQAAAAADLSDTAALHRFRLQGKRLRYMLELLWGDKAAGAAAEFTQFLKDLQEQLGNINDYASAAELLGGIANETEDAGVQSQARQLAQRELDRLEQGKAAFLGAWTARGGGAPIRAALQDVDAGLARAASPAVTQGDPG